jgi:succinate dehydrogenase/fumarate reductase iron-sulfur protein
MTVPEIEIAIRRDPATVHRYHIPYRDGMSVLDALKMLSAGQADDLAFRWECGQGVCGVCTMMINGRPALSCAVPAEPGGSYLCEPLAGFGVKKDLVVDLQPRTRQLQEQAPFLVEGGRPIMSGAEADASRRVRMCVECWACVAICPVSQESEPTHALALVKLARFALDPRDGADRKYMAREAGLVLYSQSCPDCRRCRDVCPKGIDVYLHAVKALE